MNKKQRREERLKKVQEELSGSGSYIYENNTDADLSLPRATKSGLKNIGPRQRFEGDSYYLKFISPPINLLKLIEVKEEASVVKTTTEQTVVAVEKEEEKPVIVQVVEKIKKNLAKSRKTTKKKKKKVVNNKKDNKMKEKLILDQPDIIKENGKSEPVVEDQQVEEKEVLLTEDPAGDVEIISE
jgi:hypothetical protein